MTKDIFFTIVHASPSVAESFPNLMNQQSVSCGQLSNFKQLVGCAIDVVITPLVYLVIAAALLVFLWGIFTYLKNLNNETERAKGKTVMLWGVVALFVMVSVWGLVRILTDSFVFDNSEPEIPKFQLQ